MFKKSMNIADYDPVLWQAIQDENRRQEEHIELIASENKTHFVESAFFMSLISLKKSIVSHLIKCDKFLPHFRFL